MAMAGYLSSWLSMSFSQNPKGTSKHPLFVAILRCRQKTTHLYVCRNFLLAPCLA